MEMIDREADGSDSLEVGVAFNLIANPCLDYRMKALQAAVWLGSVLSVPPEILGSVLKSCTDLRDSCCCTQ